MFKASHFRGFQFKASHFRGFDQQSMEIAHCILQRELQKIFCKGNRKAIHSRKSPSFLQSIV